MPSEPLPLKEQTEEIEWLRKEGEWLRAQVRCPECGCTTPESAEAAECGCDAPVCAIEAPNTLGMAYEEQTKEIERLRAQMEWLEKERNGALEWRGLHMKAEAKIDAALSEAEAALSVGGMGEAAYSAVVKALRGGDDE